MANRSLMFWIIYYKIKIISDPLSYSSICFVQRGEECGGIEEVKGGVEQEEEEFSWQQ